MRRSACSVYILNLAAAGFLFLCCQIVYSPQTFINSFHSKCISVPCVFLTVSVLAYISGLSFPSTLSTQHCLSVLWPIWYCCRRPRHMSAVMCALLWALSLLLSTLEGNYCGFLTRDPHPVWCPVLDFITVAWLILLFVLLCGSSLALMTRLLCGPQRVPLTRLYVTVILTVLVFLLCGLPFGIHWFLLIWFQNDFDALVPRYRVGVLLSYVNSCANPVIYFFIGSFRPQWWKRRQTLHLLLQRALQDTPDVEEHGEGLPQETLEMSRSSLVS